MTLELGHFRNINPKSSIYYFNGVLQLFYVFLLVIVFGGVISLYFLGYFVAFGFFCFILLRTLRYVKDYSHT